jgi:hypothetical protein
MLNKSVLSKAFSVAYGRDAGRRWLCLLIPEEREQREVCAVERARQLAAGLGPGVVLRMGNKGTKERREEAMLIYNVRHNEDGIAYGPVVQAKAKDVISHITELLACLKADDSISISIVEMSEEKFEALPEWDGY